MQVSRRFFNRASTLIATGATLPFYNEFALAQDAAERVNRTFPPGSVRIGSNENPLGPCPEALEAIYTAARGGGRYSSPPAMEFPKVAADQDGLKPNYVQPYPGSSDPLFRSVCAFVSSTKSLVMGDPGYEAGSRAAEFIGAKVHRVPLVKGSYKHDVKAMLAADNKAGVYYICNPNNPSGTITPKEDIAWLVANKPAGSIVLVDEAYIHFSTEESCADMVSADKDVIVLRTFSKAYGMAGIRAGLAYGRPDLLAKLRVWGAGMLPVTGMAAAGASLKVKTLVPERRKINKDIREETLAWLQKKGIGFVPTESNKFMMDVKRPGMEFVKGMAEQAVFVGRVWPIWPQHVRVTVGTMEEMKKFQAAAGKVLGV